MKIIRESMSVEDAYKVLASAGFTKNSVSPLLGNKIKDDDISASKTIADGELEVIIEFDKSGYFDKPGFSISFIGEDPDEDYMQNMDPWSLKACIKVATIAEKYFDENPVTSKFMQRFSDNYDMQFGV